MALSPGVRTGVAASLAGVLIFAGQAGQLAFGNALGPLRDIPENFILFGLGFLLLFVGHVLIATGLRDALGRAWILPLVGAAGILVAITVEDGVHDIGLFVFEGAWVALGISLLRWEHQGRPDTTSALA